MPSTENQTFVRIAETSSVAKCLACGRTDWWSNFVYQGCPDDNCITHRRQHSE